MPWALMHEFWPVLNAHFLALLRSKHHNTLTPIHTVSWIRLVAVILRYNFWVRNCTPIERKSRVKRKPCTLQRNRERQHNNYHKVKQIRYMASRKSQMWQTHHILLSSRAKIRYFLDPYIDFYTNCICIYIPVCTPATLWLILIWYQFI